LAIAVSTAGASSTISASCKEVASYFDREDREHATEAYETIKTLMTSLDRAMIEKGQRSVLAPLSKDGAAKAYLTVVAYCRERPELELGAATAQAYAGLRAFQDAVSGR